MHSLNRRRLLLGTAAVGATGALGLIGTTPAWAADNSKTAFNFLRGKGFTAAEAAGFVGNWIVESGADPINPAAKQYGGGPGRGIAQWEGSRRDALYAYANARGLSWSNLGLQLDFVWKELTSTEARAYSKVKATTSVSGAAVAVRTYYERPSVHADEARINAANLVYSRYTGSTPPSETTLPLLKSGSSGNAVRTAQYLLRHRGYSLKADGAFGSITKSKVISFQKAKGLAADGVVGPQTWMALLVKVRNGSRGDAVRALQRELNSAGKNLSVDGVFGSGTESAVRSYQKSANLDVDGVVGPDTWGSLID